jgi:DNA helicase-2/ATP-dependent DNA helicase PcrA
MLGLVASKAKRLAIPSLVKRLAELETELARLGTLPLDELVEDLFPPDDLDLCLLRDPALKAAEEADSPHDLLDRLLRAISQPEIPQSPDYVRIMSLHKSKGLTSPVVVVALAANDVIPTIKDKYPEEEQRAMYEEGRRLFYVAITRSCDELVISYPYEMTTADALSMGIKPTKYWRAGGESMARVLPSPFLAELGPSLPPATTGEDWFGHRTG